MANANEFKVTVEELTAVANGIRVLMGQPLFSSQNFNSNTDAYEWTTDYTAKLNLIQTTLSRLSNIIGITDSDGEDGIVEEIKNKIEDVQEQINALIDPADEEADSSINDAIDDIADILGDLDNIVDGDPETPSGKTPAELIEELEEVKETLEEIVDPTDENDYPISDTVDEIKDAIDDLRELDPDPEADPAEPDERTLDEVVTDISDKIDRKNELEELIAAIEEIIHIAAIITEDEDPGQDESIELSKETISDRADEILDDMYEDDLDWEDLTDDQKLILILDDLLDMIDDITEALNEYRYGDFQIVETFSEVTGSGIFDAIQNLETARRESMTAEQRAEESTVVYVSRCIFNSDQSFICTGLIDGIRKNGAFFYRDNATNNFYNTSAPTSTARLGAGKYLLRIVLRQEADFNAEI